MSRFTLFGGAHLAALASIAMVALLAIGLSRGSARSALVVRRALAAFLALAGIGAIVAGRLAGAPWGELAPLHLCDAAVVVAVWALVSLRPLACELTWFWSAGSLLALLTPDLTAGGGDALFYGYFAAHGGTVIAGLLVVLALDRRPRPGAAARAFVATNAYAACVLAVNLVFGTNYLYLLAKPAAPSPLDWFGPWPIYVLVAELVGLALFWLMALPFRRRG